MAAAGLADGMLAKTDCCPPRRWVSTCAIGMWQREHSFSIAACACGWSVTSRRTPACQYGSRAACAIIDARHIVPNDTSSPLAVVRPL